ncbi:MAG: acyloxyacyl hydrolase [Pseudogulbenkiania sp.]|nr:acyloxyacyl hydrolase [Pseudogulbenkiania sp.]
MKTITALVGLLAGFCLAPHAHALDLSLSVGGSEDANAYYRLGVQQDFTQSWWSSPSGRLTGYWDAGLTHWEADGGGSNTQSLSVSPVLVYEFSGNGIRPYLEAGIGLAVFRNNAVDERQLGSEWQFEERLGAGFRFGVGHALGLRAMHYSNAGLKKPNGGIDAYSLYYQLRY